MPRICALTFATLAALLAPAWLACAQPAPAPSGNFDEEENEPAPRPSLFVGQPIDADISRLTSMLEGSWKTMSSVGEGEDAGVLWMHMLPFETELLGRAIYVEVHADDTPWEPVRQAIFRVYRYGDALRLRTYEFRDPERARMLTSLWLTPDHMPLEEIRLEELLATKDLRFDRATGGYAGETIQAYPTPDSGSVEMTSAMRVRPDRIVSEDTFYGVDATPIPGTGAITWERGTSLVTASVGEDGLAVITYDAGKTDDPPTDEGDMVLLNYEAWRTDGTIFDSTFERGLAMRVAYPLRVVGGFKKGIEPLFEGVRRKIVIPPELGFGDVVMQNLPAGSTLVFHIHIIRVEQTDPIPMEERVKRQERP
ncbi:MAG: CpcT/CpeT family chromophore lyase [Phycisphaerales bacterium]|jgi:hypothetical protein